jgi:hypothetical protein
MEKKIGQHASKDNSTIAILSSRGEYTRLYLRGQRADGTTTGDYKIIEYRNVGTRNPDSQIQFTVEEFKSGLRRGSTKYISFSVPASLVEPFIENLKTAHNDPS